MSAFHAALQQIVKGTSLQVEVEKKVNESGSVSFKASFKSTESTAFSLDVLKADFTVSEQYINVSAKVRDVSFYSDAEQNKQKLKEQQDALKIATILVDSEEIKQHLRTVGDEEIQKVKTKLDKKVEKLEKTHEQLTKKSATELLEAMVEAVRLKHKELNGNHNGRYPIECLSEVTILVVSDNGNIVNNSVRAALSKRISFTLNLSGTGKEYLIKQMTNSWVVKNQTIKVR